MNTWHPDERIERLEVEKRPVAPDFVANVARLKRGTLGIVPENGLEEKLARSFGPQSR